MVEFLVAVFNQIYEFNLVRIGMKISYGSAHHRWTYFVFFFYLKTLVFKLDSDTLQADEEIHLQSPVKAETSPVKAKISPLKLRRSPRAQSNVNASCNFFQRNPNWTVIDYRRLGPDRDIKDTTSERCSDQLTKDPYDFIEEEEKEETASFPNDTSGHKRKLFHCSAQKRPSVKKRKLMPSPIQESLKTTPKQNKFQAPLESSLFHLENSPMFNSLESKFKDRYKRDWLFDTKLNYFAIYIFLYLCVFVCKVPVYSITFSFGIWLGLTVPQSFFLFFFLDLVLLFCFSFHFSWNYPSSTIRTRSRLTEKKIIDWKK